MKALPSLKRWYLEGVLGLFKGLGREDLDWLDRELTHQRLPKGTQLDWGGEDEQIYFLKGGVVRLWVLGPDGRELSLHYLKAGDTFGSLAPLPPGAPSQRGPRWWRRPWCAACPPAASPTSPPSALSSTAASPSSWAGACSACRCGSTTSSSKTSTNASSPSCGSWPKSMGGPTPRAA
jgi:hypothetical protein